MTDKKTNPFDLFENPAALSALKNMTPQQREEYEIMGKYMYNDNFKYTDNTIMNTMETPLQDSAAYIADGIKSGLHPSYLSEKEIEIMEEVYGKMWYKNFGYTKKDFRK